MADAAVQEGLLLSFYMCMHEADEMGAPFHVLPKAVLHCPTLVPGVKLKGVAQQWSMRQSDIRCWQSHLNSSHCCATSYSLTPSAPHHGCHAVISDA